MGTSSRARSAEEARLQRRVEREEPLRHLLANRSRVVAVLDVEVRFEELDHGEIRGRLAVRYRVRVQESQPWLRWRLRDLPDEAGLADARLPDDGHDLAVAGRGSAQRAAQQLQLWIPPDEGRHGPSGRQARLLEPLEPVARWLDGADRHELEPSLEHPRGRGAHQDRVPLGSS